MRFTILHLPLHENLPISSKSRPPSPSFRDSMLICRLLSLSRRQRLKETSPLKRKKYHQQICAAHCKIGLCGVPHNIVLPRAICTTDRISGIKHQKCRSEPTNQRFTNIAHCYIQGVIAELRHAKGSVADRYSLGFFH